MQDAVTKLLAGRTDSLVIVEFDLKKADGTGGQEVKLQGTLVGKDGLVLVSGAKQVDPPVGSTNATPEKFKVRFPGDVKRDAGFVGKDEELNLALLRITPTDEDKAEFAVGGFDPTAALAPGQPLIALKRLGRTDDDLVTIRLLRVATVIPRPGLPTEYKLIGGLSGFEGCPVYALDTRLVGFVAAATRTRGRRGGFRIVGGRLERMQPGGGGDPKGHPTRLLHSREIREFLSDPTTFARRDCWLGATGLQALTKPLAEAYGIEKPGGLVIGEVSEKSPAERAGLRAGDVIVALDGSPIETTKDRDIASFTKKIRRGKAGAEHDLAVLRRGEEGFAKLSIKVALEEAPLSENEVSDYHDKTFGLKLKPLTRDFLERSRLSLDTKGLRVTSVERASWAYIAGIRSGDVIQKMVLKPCENLEQYKKIMSELMKTRDAEVCYNVTRARKSLFLCVRPDWETVEKPEK
ncbi:MAG: PDZ domain-containing protein [Planctomycetota bacterium]